MTISDQMNSLSVRVRLASPALIIMLLLGFLRWQFFTSFIRSLFRVHYQQLRAQSTNVVVPLIESNDNCTALVADTKSLLHSANVQVIFRLHDVDCGIGRYQLAKNDSPDCPSLIFSCQGYMLTPRFWRLH